MYTKMSLETGLPLDYESSALRHGHSLKDWFKQTFKRTENKHEQ